MLISRGGYDFNVVDDPATRGWKFWSQWADGSWEPRTLDLIQDALASLERTQFIDVGAWVGPTTLWASIWADVLAVEPDPVALRVLLQNVHGLPVTVDERALAPDNKKRLLYEGGNFGDSTSSLKKHHEDVSAMAVWCSTWQEITRGWKPSLIKIDIEGGEGLVLPAIAEDLRAAACPVILGWHKPWLSTEENQLVEEVINSFTNEVLEDHPDFPTIVLY